MPSAAQRPLAPESERGEDDPQVPDLAMYSRSRMASDLYGRSLAGPLFYIIGSLVCAAVGGYFQPLRTVAWVPTFVYALIFVLRRLNRPPSGVSREDVFREWRRRHLALNYGTCLGWALVVMGVVAIERAPTLTVTVAVVCTVMYGSAISQAFAMDRAGTTTTLAILLVPMILTGIVFAPFRAIAVTLVFYFAYSVWNLRRLASEYEAQMTTEHALVLSRAEVEKLSRVDALTTLANRRDYESAYPRAWQQASRARTDLALLLLDIDHFKKVNDTYGHLAGDACLQHFAQLMRNRFRRNVDLLARIGGEELVVVLPGCTPEDARCIAEAFREDVERSPCTTGGHEVRMTVSIGVGSADWNVDKGPDGTFARVDVACYEAKTSGRNRVVVAKADSAVEKVPSGEPTGDGMTPGTATVIDDPALPAAPTLASYRYSRVATDLYGRGLIGPLFYIFGSLTCAAVGGYFHPLRAVAWVPTVYYAVIFALRRLNRPPERAPDGGAFRGWLWRHRALVHAICLGWALVDVAIVDLERAPTITVTVAAVCTVMFGSGIAHAFAVDRAGTTSTLVLLVAPLIATGVYFAPFRPIALTLVVNFGYVAWTLRRLAREYEAQVAAEHALVLSRAEVEKLSRVDALTTLANRRDYESAYPRAWQQASRARTDLALLLLDIDHFKKVNDTYGHLAGDACLQHFAQLMRNRFRRNVDLLARIGGEELVVVLPGCTPEDARCIAEAFREDVERSPCTTGGHEVRMTVSIGVGSADWNVDKGPDGTFARVDVACYEAKTSGRNRVVVAKADSAGG